MKQFFAILCCALSLSAPLWSAAMDSRVRSLNPTLAEQVFTAPEQNLPAVVNRLTSGTSGVEARVKVLHDWICDNIAYDTEVFDHPEIQRIQDYATVLRKKKAVCSGYTNLMNEMCRLAGVESIGIIGYSKGFGYRGTIQEGQHPDHAWNAIRIGNRWQLIDVTWDAGFCELKHFVKHYTTDWFRLTPEQFIFSHLPLDEQYQYLKKTITKEEFVAQPYVPGRFFAQGLGFTKDMPQYTNTIAKAVSFTFTVRDSATIVNTAVIDADTGQPAANASFADRMAGKVIVTFDVPDKKTYKAKLTTRRRDETMNPMYIPTGEWESYVMPQAGALLAQKKITQKEYDFLAESYYKVKENGRYYLAEDLFATARNTAVTKTLKAISYNTNNFEETLSLDIKAGETYSGYGSGRGRFPLVYAGYADAQNIQLISPREGVLRKGSVQTFSIKCKDYTGFAFILSNGEWKFLTFNSSNGCYELEMEIPSDEESLTLMGTKDKRRYDGLVTFALEEEQ